ncbi:sigma-54-dependent Fis family transcriptional regulator [bacterium]|nr:sigma-54-dependent Fis family transcriptional regulator [bacterium]
MAASRTSKARARARALRKKGDLHGARRVLEGAREEALGLERATVEADLAEVRAAIEVLATHELALARDEPRPRGSPGFPDGFVGRSAAAARVRGEIARAASAALPVLIEGESGTGKEVVARAIHARSSRAKGPFVALAPAAFAPGMIEDELFGHVAGAFTGAEGARDGLLLGARGGTVLLDGIDEMPLDVQAKLLRVLEEGEVRPVGGGSSVRVDARIVATTRRSLGSLVRQGVFREELFYRLNVLKIVVPPLRERDEDVGVLVSELLERHGAGRFPAITRPALERLERYPWPGNVRELENEVRRLLVVAVDPIDEASLSPRIRKGDASPSRDLSKGIYERLRGRSLEEIERAAIQAALRASEGNRTGAARLLKVSRRTLYDKLKRLGLDS